ncbi:MAG: PfkB family carbohydrate kinase [Treponema sp.]|jgi:sugar/nucleoside kinase (ribokinase family)|nr:PfkB family carbohydrate kinase [Treponema sp.]
MDGTGLFCLGNALVDLFADVEDGAAAALGLSEPVQHVSPERMQELLAALPEPSAASGGGAANAAKTASLLGVQTVFAGTIGRDSWGDFFEQELCDAGVRPLLGRTAASTGICLVLREAGGRRVIAACPAAALELKTGDIPPDRVRQAGAVVIDGYMLGRQGLGPESPVQRILDLAGEYGIVAVLDLGSAAIAAGCAGELARRCHRQGVAPLMLFMNEAEAWSFYQALEGAGTEAYWRLSAYFCRFTAPGPFPLVVVKRGALGSEVYAGGRRYQAPTEALETADSLGAGDAYCGGFMAAWLRGKFLRQCLPGECAALGNRAARTVLDAPGARLSRERLVELAKEAVALGSFRSAKKVATARRMAKGEGRVQSGLPSDASDTS